LWVLATLSSLALLIVLVLCIPLDLTLHIDIHGRPKVRTRLVWLFGLVSKEIRRGEKKPRDKSREARDKRKPGKKKGTVKTAFQILRTKGLLKQFKRLLKDIISRFKIRELRVNLRIGLDHPADTGLFFAIVGPITYLLKSPQHIILQPAFDEAVLEGDLSGAVRLQPIQLVVPLLRFALSLSTIRIIKTLVLTKWKRKK